MSELAARVRAARAYAGLRQEDLAEELGVDVQTIKRREGGSNDPKKGELRAIAVICGVPKEFFDTSRPLELVGPVDVSERVQVLNDLAGRQQASIDQLESAIRDLVRAAITRPGELDAALERRLRRRAERPPGEAPGERQSDEEV